MGVCLARAYLCLLASLLFAANITRGTRQGLVGFCAFNETVGLVWPAARFRIRLVDWRRTDVAALETGSSHDFLSCSNCKPQYLHHAKTLCSYRDWFKVPQLVLQIHLVVSVLEE